MGTSTLFVVVERCKDIKMFCKLFYITNPLLDAIYWLFDSTIQVSQNLIYISNLPFCARRVSCRSIN